MFDHFDVGLESDRSGWDISLSIFLQVSVDLPRFRIYVCRRLHFHRIPGKIRETDGELRKIGMHFRIDDSIWT